MPDDRHGTNGVIAGPAAPERRDDPEGHADRERHEERQDLQLEAVPDALGDQLRDRPVVVEGVPEVEGGHVTEVAGELHRHWIVEPEVLGK